jgi:hypothetical protein
MRGLRQENTQAITVKLIFGVPVPVPVSAAVAVPVPVQVFDSSLLRFAVDLTHRLDRQFDKPPKRMASLVSGWWVWGLVLPADSDMHASGSQSPPVDHATSIALLQL